MKFHYLHIASRCCGGPGVDASWCDLGPQFYRDVRAQAGAASLDAVFLAGDIGYSGAAHEYEKATQFLCELKRELSPLLDRAFLLLVPGDRDVAWSPALGEEEFRERAAYFRTLQNDAAIREKFFQDSQYRDQKMGPLFRPYEAWARTAHEASGFHKPELLPGLLPGEFAATIPFGPYSVGVVGLNSACLPSHAYQPGDILLDSQQLHAACGGQVRAWTQKHLLNILLTHHAASWIGGHDSDFPGRIGDHFQLHLSGQGSEVRPGRGNEADVLSIRPLGSSVHRYEVSARSLCYVERERERHREVLGYYLGRIELHGRHLMHARDGYASLYLRARRFNAWAWGRGYFDRDPAIPTPLRSNDYSAETDELRIPLGGRTLPPSRLSCTIVCLPWGWRYRFSEPSKEKARFRINRTPQMQDLPEVDITTEWKQIETEYANAELSLLSPSATVHYYSHKRT